MSLSWLQLERYALGECDVQERRAIEVALDGDPDARAILAAIRTDNRPVAPLIVPRPRPRWPWGLVGLALAAVALLVAVPERQAPFKGGTEALQLVRMRDGAPQLDPESVRVGERLGLRLTCPPGRTEVDVVVFHGGEGAFPLQPTTVDCGNGVLLPGAFSADAPGPLVACVVLGELPPREVLATGPAAASLCVRTEVN